MATSSAITTVPTSTVPVTPAAPATAAGAAAASGTNGAGYVPATAGVAQPSGFWTPPSIGEALKNWIGKYTGTQQVGIVARMRDQADLSTLSGYGADRRTQAWDALQKTAAATQGPIKDILDGMRQSGAVTGYDAWSLGNTFEVSVPAKAWRGVHDALQATGKFDLLMAYDNFGMLAYENTFDQGLADRAADAISQRREGIEAPKATPFGARWDEIKRRAKLVKEALNPPRDPAFDVGPKDAGTSLFDENGNGWQITQTGADQLWKQGITGKGVRVGMIDTGVDGAHPVLRGAVGAKGDSQRWYQGAAERGDREGHGTHVAGLVVGRDPKGVRNTGLAPDAQLMVAQMDGSLLGSFQWMLAPEGANGVADASKGADLVTNSWGIQGPMTAIADSLITPLKQMKAAGTTVLFAAGNSGPGEGTVAAPGSSSDVITIGANRRDGTIATFSSRAEPGLNKPDITAPGASVPSSVPVSNVGNMLPMARITNIITGNGIGTQAEQHPVKGTGGAMWQMSGTSMATPVTAGGVALLLQKYPTLLPDQVKQVLTESAIDMGPAGRDGWYGQGRLDLVKAAEVAERLTSSTAPA